MILCYWLPSFIIYHETRINYINIITTKCDNRVFKDVLLINRMKNEGKVKIIIIIIKQARKNHLLIKKLN